MRDPTATTTSLIQLIWTIIPPWMKCLIPYRHLQTLMTRRTGRILLRHSRIVITFPGLTSTGLIRCPSYLCRTGHRLTTYFQSELMYRFNPAQLCQTRRCFQIQVLDFSHPVLRIRSHLRQQPVRALVFPPSCHPRNRLCNSWARFLPPPWGFRWVVYYENGSYQVLTRCFSSCRALATPVNLTI